MKIAELKNRVQARETTLLHILKQFQNLNLVVRALGVYSLTSLGTIEAIICKEVTSTNDVIMKFSDFWLLHDISTLPTNLICTIGALKDSDLFRTEPTDLSGVHNLFIKIAKASKSLRGVSPIFHPDFVGLFTELLEQGNSIELITTNNVMEKVINIVDLGLLDKYIKNNKLRLFLNENIRFALSLTETIFSLGLFNVSGEYDDKMDLVSTSTEAIEWGQQLFEETKKLSKVWEKVN